MADFIDVKYETDAGVIVLAKLDVLTAPQAGTPPTGPVDIPLHAIQSKSRRNAGVHSRRMNLSRQVGTAPNQGVRYKQIPLLTPAAYEAAIALVGTTITINAVVWTVNSVSAEVVR